VQPIYGPRDVGFGEVVRIIGGEIGQEVKYVAAPREAILEGLLHGGASRNVAEAYADLFTDLARFGFPREPRDEALVGQTAIEEWVRGVFVPALGSPVPT
jgi:hypothetical protein